MDPRPAMFRQAALTLAVVLLAAVALATVLVVPLALLVRS